ncbi:hypothetical protein [Actinoplanes lobatus]|uniref:Uncharacterized protein n=1 Tax=Actinoplanes lobatus TaxID=113568 RepID=A0A7W7HIE7_9ACTN|nr:hypothetical protein [Actinoplanes lobatus]MBB4751123.1 hypothetical protein [Actinoplanes lobatus]GIE44619.1 hypothetical protein Alo02nite_75170 [Actinoplanes lobatus]
MDRADTYDFLHLGLFCHGVASPGSVTAAEWRDLLDRAGVKGAFAGVSPRRYPADPGTFFEFPHALRAIPRRHPIPGCGRSQRWRSVLPLMCGDGSGPNIIGNDYRR